MYSETIYTEISKYRDFILFTNTLCLYPETFFIIIIIIYTMDLYLEMLYIVGDISCIYIQRLYIMYSYQGTDTLYLYQETLYIVSIPRDLVYVCRGFIYWYIGSVFRCINNLLSETLYIVSEFRYFVLILYLLLCTLYPETLYIVSSSPGSSRYGKCLCTHSPVMEGLVPVWCPGTAL